MKKLTKNLMASLLIIVSPTIFATTVTYELTNISGNTWEHTYNITNDTLLTDIEEFTIFFDVGLFQNLLVTATPANWDPLVIEPDASIPDDGFYDALALSNGIAQGASLNGFSVQFDYLGTGAPGAQLFEIIDPNTFALLDSGTTQISVVPVPAAFWLFASGLFFLNRMKSHLSSITSPHWRSEHA